MPIAAKAGEEPTLPNAALRSNRSEAQIATFAKSGPDREHGRANGPKPTFRPTSYAAMPPAGLDIAPHSTLAWSKSGIPCRAFLTGVILLVVAIVQFTQAV
ncbi:hypothetical protein SCH4B_0140 [Ruegeria sp. TrichCH4B]|nr:hypothetical protein SCH4B_0140 [Ruegeria sp. TrichCH4B]